MSKNTEKVQSDHKLIPFELTKIDKYTLLYCIIGNVVLIAMMDWLLSFDGTWIWGMPRSAFGIAFIGVIIGTIAIIALYNAYKSFFAKIEE